MSDKKAFKNDYRDMIMELSAQEGSSFSGYKITGYGYEKEPWGWTQREEAAPIRIYVKVIAFTDVLAPIRNWSPLTEVYDERENG